MSDDLVKRLRDTNGGWASDEALAAADRIEVLETKLDLSEGALDIASKSWDECQRTLEQTEAKLAKMLEIVRRHDTGDMRREDMEARRILEKLEDVMKGDTDA